MPLKPGNTRNIIGGNVSEMMHSGRPQEQAVAIALSNARRHPGGFAAGGAPDLNLNTPSVDQVAALLPPRAIQPGSDYGMPVPDNMNVRPATTASPTIIPQRKPGSYYDGTLHRTDAMPPQQPAYGGYKSGGAPHMASGGSNIGEMAPWYTKREASGQDQFHGGGLFNASSAGRTDVLNRTVPAGAYVLPADVVSGLGEGNTMAGSNVLDAMMHSLPYGIKGGRGGHGGVGIPRAPSGYKMPAFKLKTGGSADDPKHQGHVPIVAAGGEYLVPKDKVMALGGGDIKHGHRILDAFVLHIRKKTAKTLHKLPGPKK